MYFEEYKRKKIVSLYQPQNRIQNSWKSHITTLESERSWWICGCSKASQKGPGFEGSEEKLLGISYGHLHLLPYKNHINTGTQEGSKNCLESWVSTVLWNQGSSLRNGIWRWAPAPTHTPSNAQPCSGHLSHNHKSLKHLQTIRIKYKPAFQEWNSRKVNHFLD